MGATTTELDSSHVPILSQPERVLDVIRAAVKAVQAQSAAALSGSGRDRRAFTLSQNRERVGQTAR
jgi:hypothetical protein